MREFSVYTSRTASCGSYFAPPPRLRGSRGLWAGAWRFESITITGSLGPRSIGDIFQQAAGLPPAERWLERVSLKTRGQLKAITDGKPCHDKLEDKISRVGTAHLCVRRITNAVDYEKDLTRAEAVGIARDVRHLIRVFLHYLFIPILLKGK